MPIFPGDQNPYGLMGSYPIDPSQYGYVPPLPEWNPNNPSPTEPYRSIYPARSLWGTPERAPYNTSGQGATPWYRSTTPNITTRLPAATVGTSPESWQAALEAVSASPQNLMLMGGGGGGGGFLGASPGAPGDSSIAGNFPDLQNQDLTGERSGMLGGGTGALAAAPTTQISGAMPAPENAPLPPPLQGSGTGMTPAFDPTALGMLNAGLGIMGQSGYSPTPISAAGAIGRGAPQGIQTYLGARQQLVNEQMVREQQAYMAQLRGAQAQELASKIREQNRMNDLQIQLQGVLQMPEGPEKQARIQAIVTQMNPQDIAKLTVLPMGSAAVNAFGQPMGMGPPKVSDMALHAQELTQKGYPKELADKIAYGVIQPSINPTTGEVFLIDKSTGKPPNYGALGVSKERIAADVAAGQGGASGAPTTATTPSGGIPGAPSGALPNPYRPAPGSAMPGTQSAKNLEDAVNDLKKFVQQNKLPMIESHMRDLNGYLEKYKTHPQDMPGVGGLQNFAPGTAPGTLASFLTSSEGRVIKATLWQVIGPIMQSQVGAQQTVQEANRVLAQVLYDPTASTADFYKAWAGFVSAYNKEKENIFTVHPDVKKEYAARTRDFTVNPVPIVLPEEPVSSGPRSSGEFTPPWRK